MSQLREQFIERLVREFFLKKGSGFVLKGGGAVRALFGTQRLTKDVDLDFTNPKRTAESLHKTVNRAIEAAARGLPVRDMQISTPSKSERTSRWNVNFRDQDGAPFHVEIEISRDPGRAPPGGIKQQPFAPEAAKGIARFWVDIYEPSTLIATKLAALLGRGTPRDLYDLDLLMAASPPPAPEQIQWAINRADLKGAEPLSVLEHRLSALTWNRYTSELRDALPPHIAERIDETEWRALIQRVGDYAKSQIRRQQGAGK